MDNPVNNSVKARDVVVGRGSEVIQARFETLWNSKGQSPTQWYNDLNIDKSNASKIRRGLIIPPKHLRIQIAQYFGVDSATIWEIDFRKWCEVHDAIEDLWEKVEEVNKNG